eukprot:3898889-Pyramimonas_sp.AAC.1
MSGGLEADRREGPKKVRIGSKSPVYLCGMCPVDEPGALDLAFVSLCELLPCWRVSLAADP